MNEEESSRVEYARDGPEAQRIARTIPYYPFKGIERFYDIGGTTRAPIAVSSCSTSRWHLVRKPLKICQKGLTYAGAAQLPLKV